MSWISKIVPSKIRSESAEKRAVPEGLWTKCEACQSMLYTAELERAMHVCPKCGNHAPMAARQRLQSFLDNPQGWQELSGDIESVDPLKFRDSRRYKERIAEAVRSTGEKEALLAVQGELKGLAVVACAMDFRFMGGSMGSVVGEVFVRAVDASVGRSLPLVCFAASGGARMQEGLLSLMQMAKTSAALTRLAERGVPFISVLTNPTMGGVAASFAMLGDVIIAEPKALIGFAGPRVIRETVRQELPEGFQRSEFLLEHGAVDMIVDRREMRDRIHRLLAVLTKRPAGEGDNG